MVVTLILPFLICLSVIRIVSAISAHDQQCQKVSTNKEPSLTMQFTPSYPTQIAPTSTVFGAIMTSYMNVVDCNYVMVENVDNNPVQSGKFTTRITVPILTVYRVGCMPETTIVSRRDFQEPKTKRSIEQQTATPTVVTDGEHTKRKRTEFEGSSLNTLLSIANRLSSGVDPTNENMTVGEFRFLRQINTALFALNIINSGLPLSQMCQYLRDPAIGNHLDENLINQDQAANIVCFASVYGLYFQESNEELLEDLAALEYAIQMKAYSSETLREVCQELDYQAASFLDIDVEGIRDRVCNGTAGIAHTTSISTVGTLPISTTVTMTGITTSAPLHTSAAIGPYPTGTGTGFGTGSSTEWVIPATGSQIPPIIVSTGSGGIPTIFGATSTIIYGSDGPAFSSATSAAGTVGPWFNTSVTTTTASAGGIGSEPASASPMFYTPPRLVRSHLRRHVRAM